jgi:DNA mismatch repair protein MutH
VCSEETFLCWVIKHEVKGVSSKRVENNLACVIRIWIEGSRVNVRPQCMRMVSSPIIDDKMIQEVTDEGDQSRSQVK